MAGGLFAHGLPDHLFTFILSTSAPVRPCPPAGSTYVANRVSNKITRITDSVYCCRSGSAADTQALAEIVSYRMAMHEVTPVWGRPPGRGGEGALGMERFQCLCAKGVSDPSGALLGLILVPGMNL